MFSPFKLFFPKIFNADVEMKSTAMRPTFLSVSKGELLGIKCCVLWNVTQCAPESADCFDLITEQ